MFAEIFKACLTGSMAYRIFSVALFLLILVWYFWGTKEVQDTAGRKTSSQLTMEQSVNNSPGSNNYQAGRDLHVYNGPQNRTISGQKQREMVQVLQPLAGSKINIDFVGGAETTRLAKQIKEIFVSAGWSTGNICKVANASYENVSIKINEAENTSKQGVALVKNALKIAGFEVPIYVDKRTGAADIAICIGDQI